MIKKNGLDFSIAQTTVAATALFAFCNFSSNTSFQPYQMSYKQYSIVEESPNTCTANSVRNSFSSEYYNTSASREKLWSIFGETRDLTEEEAEIYDKLLDSEAIETGVRLF